MGDGPTLLGGAHPWVGGSWFCKKANLESHGEQTTKQKLFMTIASAPGSKYLIKATDCFISVS